MLSAQHFELSSSRDKELCDGAKHTWALVPGVFQSACSKHWFLRREPLFLLL